MGTRGEKTSVLIKPEILYSESGLIIIDDYRDATSALLRHISLDAVASIKRNES